MEAILKLPPSLSRDAVRLDGLRRRAELNECHGIVRSKRGRDLFEVLVGDERFLVKFANLTFVGAGVPLFRTADVQTEDLAAVLREGLVLDDSLLAVYASGSVGHAGQEV